MITLENLSKTYVKKKKKTNAVNNINLTIATGEIFGIIGYSGAGKSTLIRMMNLLEIPTKGQVIIDEHDVTSMNKLALRNMRKKIGMIFQHFNLLWSKTVFENIAFPLEIAKENKSMIQKRVNELIQLVGLEGKENHYPKELSGGEKQRVGIARALANNPRVLLCDEATSALDPETTDSILDLLQDINQRLGLTIVLITHEMYVIKKICHRVAVMEKGQIIEKGNVLDVFTQPKEKMTKKFVSQIADDPLPVMETLRQNYKEGCLVLLKYVNDDFERPLITKIVQTFNVTVNILHGKVIQTSKGSYGVLQVQLIGDQIEETIQYLEETGVVVEVIYNE